MSFIETRDTTVSPNIDATRLLSQLLVEKSRLCRRLGDLAASPWKAPKNNYATKDAIALRRINAEIERIKQAQQNNDGQTARNQALIRRDSNCTYAGFCQQLPQRPCNGCSQK